MTTPTASLPYVILLPSPTGEAPTGGDSLTEDLNLYYQSGNIAWLITATALVLLMAGAVASYVHGAFYSGLARRKSALSLLWLSVMGTAVVTFQWFLWGYSLAFSHTAGPFIGDLANLGLANTLGAPSVASPLIPDLLFCVYQGMFAAIT